MIDDFKGDRRTRCFSEDSIFIGDYGHPVPISSDSNSEETLAVLKSLDSAGIVLLCMSLGLPYIRCLDPPNACIRFPGQSNAINLIRWVWGNPRNEYGKRPSVPVMERVPLVEIQVPGMACFGAGYGYVGMLFTNIVSKNVDEMETLVKTLRPRYEIYNLPPGFDAIVAVTVAAALVANNAGILKLDAKEFQFEVISLLGSGTATEKEPRAPLKLDSTFDDIKKFIEYLERNKPDMAITKRWLRYEGGKYEINMHEIFGRVVENEGALYLPVSKINDWCDKNGLASKKFVKLLSDRGLLLSLAPKKLYLAKGTTMTSGQQRCYALDWAKLYDLLQRENSNAAKVHACGV